MEHLFRLLPVLVLLPLLAIGAAVYWDIAQPPTYAARSTLWVTESGTPGGAEKVLGAENVYASPSQRQVDAFYQLMASDAFALRVAQRSGLLDDVSDRDLDWRTLDYVERESRAREEVRRSINVYSGGTNLMNVTASHEDPALALALAEAGTGLYLERVQSEANRKTDLAVEFYQQRVEGARVSLDQIDRELAAYVAAHPRPANGPAPFDLAFERLEAQFQAQNQLVTDLRQQLELAQLDAATADGSQVRYALLDAPALPTNPQSPGLRARAMPLAYALAFSGGLVAVLWYVSIATDHSVRSSEDMQEMGVPVLAFLPEFDSRGLQPWVLRPIAKRDRSYARKIAADLAPQRLERGA